jgi:hypothetical protein
LRMALRIGSERSFATCSSLTIVTSFNFAARARLLRLVIYFSGTCRPEASGGGGPSPLSA